LPAGFDELLGDLEETIARLATGTAPLEELVVAHQKAVQLLGEASARLDELKTRAELIARSLAE
jgi:exodeoxyribonuclease VII small subunit